MAVQRPEAVAPQSLVGGFSDFVGGPPGADGLGSPGLAWRLRSGELPVREYIETCLARIDAYEPVIKALLPEPGRRERLLAEAAALEARWPDPAERPALYGLLFGAKDIFAADGFETRAGSRLPCELFRMPEGPVVRAMKDAGALLLGKTVTTEFAYFAPGPTGNPWNPSHTPGGSSSGSAAAVAAGFCALATGTQTIGSISRPAAFCGVAGWKPSYERTSRDGVVPFSPSVDHVGLFAADPASLALGAAAVVSDWRHSDFASAVKTYASSLPVLAVPEGPYLDQAEPMALSAFRAQIDLLRRAGFSVLPVPAFDDIDEINARHRRICAADLERVHHDWFAIHEGLYSSQTTELIHKGAVIADDELEHDKAGRFEMRARLERLLDEAGADLWISPAAPGPAPAGLAATGSPIMNLPWTFAGLPTLALPAGLSSSASKTLPASEGSEGAHGLPLGLQLAARFGRDEELLAMGCAVGKALPRIA
jgi:Asp-tRNA(Asn)/Glu-tRNA(Gln) amidotransferase A subunit family amidase